jgi:hypothetical protein
LEEVVQIIALKRFGGAPHYNQLAPLYSLPNLSHHQSAKTSHWNLPTQQSDKAKNINAKFKNLRRVLKAWKLQLPSLGKTIQNCKEIILFLDIMEEFRDLTVEE